VFIVHCNSPYSFDMDTIVVVCCYCKVCIVIIIIVTRCALCVSHLFALIFHLIMIFETVSAVLLTCRQSLFNLLVVACFERK